MNTLMMLVGPSYCGKSFFAKMMKNLLPERVEIFSSDEIREEIYGDAGCQDNPTRVFEILHQRITDCLKEKQNVIAIYDATNLSRKRRCNFLNSIRTIACRRTCVVFPISLDELLDRVPLRDRKVPEQILLKQIKNFQCPQKEEGWDEIVIEFQGDGYDAGELEEKCSAFDQKNQHHSLTLKEHLKKTAELVATTTFSEAEITESKVVTDAYKMLVAAYYHDIGKLLTQKIDENGEAHYYNHHNASAYMWLCLKSTKEMVEKKVFSQQDVLDIVFLIQNHMEFFFRNQEGLRRLQESTSPILWKSLNVIHRADLMAH